MTYGDMMSLLLCFFVLIVSFSEIKKDDEYQAVVEEIQQAFGMSGGGGKMPTPDDPALSMIQLLESLRLQNETDPNRSNAQDPGQEGREQQVRQVREGMKFAVGGRITFEPGSAELSSRAKRELREVAPLLEGMNNLIEIRGHAAPLELPRAEREAGGLWNLSHQRAQAVMAYLTGDEVKLSPERFRLIANADREPLQQRADSVLESEPNRRVEVLLSESLKRDFTEPEAR